MNKKNGIHTNLTDKSIGILDRYTGLELGFQNKNNVIDIALLFFDECMLKVSDDPSALGKMLTPNERATIMASILIKKGGK